MDLSLFVLEVPGLSGELSQRIGLLWADGLALMALIAACVLVPADDFAINTAPAVFAKRGMTPVDLAG